MLLSTNLPLNLLETKWASILNPIISNPMTNMAILKDVSLVTGTNIINHLLQQMQLGWIITDIQGAATIYRNAAFNDLTLSLHSSAPVTVSIGVF